MEIAIGIVFLAFFVGAIFLVLLISGLLVRRRKRRNLSPNRHSFRRRIAGSRNDPNDDPENDYDDAAYFAAASYSNSYSEENKEAGAGMSFSDSDFGQEVSAVTHSGGATEGGDYASSGSDHSSSYDSGSSGDSGSGSSGNSD